MASGSNQGTQEDAEAGEPARAAQPVPEAQPIGSGDRVVGEGDTMVLIAEESGHFWQKLWNLPANQALKAARKHPNVLLPGDRVTVPAIAPKELSCETGKKHVFRRKGIPADISFQVKTQDGKVLDGRKYVLRVGKREYRGVTDAEGKLHHFVDAATRTGELTVWVRLGGLPKTMVWRLSVGDLGPIDTVSGVRARLLALGYPAGHGAAADRELRAALCAFQADRRLGETGEMDQATIDSLEQTYGF